ncbi:MAG: ABC transporter ATP-binding protein [Candidatus Limnocylindria bacterium]
MTVAPAAPTPLSADIVLATHGLVKKFGQLTAVDRLDIEVRRGEVVGLLGPNGAGKSTTIGMILGLVVPTSGRAEVMGRDVWHSRQNALAAAGAIVETPAFYPYLSGRDNLRALALIRGGDAHTRVDPLLARLGLADRAGSKYRTYSLGMKQRLGIASTLLSDPALVILDEPANGLDPAGQREIRELIRELATEGHGVLLASHVLHEVELICDRVLVVNKGRLIASGTIAEVTHGASYFDVEVAEPARAAAALRAVPGVGEVREADGRLHVVFDAARGADLSRALAGAGLFPSALVPRKSSLEDVFLELTDDGGGDAAPS